MSSVGMVPMHGHIHGHINGHARKKRRLWGHPKTLIAQIVSSWRQQHLRMIHRLLRRVIFVARALSRVDNSVLQREQHVGHIRARLLLISQRVLAREVRLCSTKVALKNPN